MGKKAVVKTMIEQAAERRPTSDDWYYVFNSQEANRPRALILPPWICVTLAVD
jgi:hypothetical protein